MIRFYFANHNHFAMLYGTVTPHGLGVVLYGDYLDLITLRTTITESIPDEEDEQGLNTYLLAMCYDLRKAADGSGDCIEVQSFWTADGTMMKQCYRTVTLSWPVFLYCLNMLEQLAQKQPSNLFLRAAASQLKALAFEAIKDRYPIDDGLVMALLTPLSPYIQTAVAKPIVQTAETVLLDKDSAEARFFALPYVMSMLTVGTPAYRDVLADLKKAARHHGCSIDQLELPVDYDDDAW
jgi:hypothetical protein